MKTDLKLLSKIAQLSNSLNAFKFEVTEYRYVVYVNAINSDSNCEFLEELRKQIYKFFLNSFDVIPDCEINEEFGWEYIFGGGLEVTIYYK